MTDIRCRFIERVERTPWVSSFRFQPEAKVHFTPGQFLQVFFDEQNPQNRQWNKFLSFSCSPDRDYIEVTKRDRGSEFAKRLWGLQPGQEVLLKGPMGKCVFKEEYAKIAFLIGGIGITPVISMLGYIVERKIPTDAVLLYSNLTEGDIPFKAELDRWRVDYPQVKVVYTVVEKQPKDPAIQFGLIDKDFVSRDLPDVRDRKIFLLGPPGMVKAMEQICREIGCPPDNLLIEKFIGYD